MRHLWSFLAGVVVAPITWLLIALGQGRSTSTVAGWVDAGRYDTTNLIEPAAYLAAAGILLGLLGTLRISPLGPLVAGLLLLGAYAGMFATPFALHDNVPDNERILGRVVPLHLPLDNGTLFLIGALLLMATFSAQRWRRWPAVAAASTGAATADQADAPTGELADPAATGSTPAPAGATRADEVGARAAASAVAREAAAGGDGRDVAANQSGAPAGDGEATPGLPTQRSGEPVDVAPLPRRRDSQSPWSTPPQGAGSAAPQSPAPLAQQSTAPVAQQSVASTATETAAEGTAVAPREGSPSVPRQETPRQEAPPQDAAKQERSTD